MNNNLVTILLLLAFATFQCSGQSVQDLLDGYSEPEGVVWDAQTATITFQKSGIIPFSQNGWDVPASVKKIFIKANVTITGRFDCAHNLLIEGEDRTTSVLFGTDQQGYAKQNGGGDKLSAIRVTAGNVTVKNLTSRNSKGFHFTSRGSSGFFEIIDCDLLDVRGGGGNNSDGIVTWGGGRVKNCYIASGDDAIKVYSDIIVEDTHIEMIQNTMPIQFGWGNYGSGAVGVFKNLKITGTSGRFNAGRAIIAARTGNYDKTLTIDGLEVDNPNGSVFSFREGMGTFNITITNAKINVPTLISDWNNGVQGTITICGQQINQNSTQNNWDCFNSTATKESFLGQKSIFVFPNPVSDRLHLNEGDETPLFSIYDNLGRQVLSGQYNKSGLEFNSHPSGTYFIRLDNNQVIPFVKQ
ncbi:MAG: T9SS type A sorting domain-containing protein [Bacteroidota bacterium]